MQKTITELVVAAQVSDVDELLQAIRQAKLHGDGKPDDQRAADPANVTFVAEDVLDAVLDDLELSQDMDHAGLDLDASQPESTEPSELCGSAEDHQDEHDGASRTDGDGNEDDEDNGGSFAAAGHMADAGHAPRQEQNEKEGAGGRGDGGPGEQMEDEAAADSDDDDGANITIIHTPVPPDQ